MSNNPIIQPEECPPESPQDAGMKAAPMKKEEDGMHPASHYLVVEDPQKPSTWHLRVRNVDGSLNHRLLGAAWAALHEGYRGHRYKGPNKQLALRKLVKLYKEAGLSLPAVRSISSPMDLYGVRMLGETETGIRIGGYGIVWGAKDVTGHTFRPDTELWLSMVPTKACFYDHTLSGIKEVIGETRVEEPDEYGVWVEAQIDRHNQYAEQIEQLLERGVLGWSSGTAAHLIDTDGSNIKRWPVVEYSLTPTPAEPRTVGVGVLSQIANRCPELKGLLPEVAQEVTAETDNQEDAVSNIKSFEPPNTASLEDASMTAQTTKAEDSGKVGGGEAQAPGLDVTAITDALKSQLTSLVQEAAQDAVRTYLDTVPNDTAGFAVDSGKTGTKSAPSFLRSPLGDTETGALASWVRTGDGGTAYNGFKLVGGTLDLAAMEAARLQAFGVKASNDTTMNITTPADGGYASPTGHFQNIIARRDELLLAQRLGVRLIPGRGTTVNVTIDKEGDGEFVTTAEQNDAHTNNYDRDAPELGRVEFTLVKKTKKIELTDEIMDDEDSNLMAFLEDFIGRGIAKTHNQMLLSAVGSEGTKFLEFASTSAIAAGEPQQILGNDDLANYMDDDTGIFWVGRSSVYWNIASITGNPFLYAPTPAGGTRELLGYPFLYSNKAGNIAASSKSLFFGNWYFVGYRDPKGLVLLRDPYSVDGVLVLKYRFRTVYHVLVAEAIGYGEHPAS